jgi:hypothetical protein
MIFVFSFVCIMRELWLSNFFVSEILSLGHYTFVCIGSFAAILKTRKLK